MLSIIIPCYDEEKTIKSLLNELFTIEFPINREIIVVDDGSKVNLKNILKKEINNNKIKFIRLPKNHGKGVAIRVGLKYAIGNIFIIQDADYEYYPTDIPMLLEPILNKETFVVYGTRFNSAPKGMSKSHYYANAFLTKITNFIYKINLTDMETGYKVFTKEVLDKIDLKAREFEFEPEITAKIALYGFKIKEIPINYHYRKVGMAKINWLDGFECVLLLIQLRFYPESKLYQFVYNIYKYHIKRIIFKLTKFTSKYIYLRRI